MEVARPDERAHGARAILDDHDRAVGHAARPQRVDALADGGLGEPLDATVEGRVEQRLAPVAMPHEPREVRRVEREWPTLYADRLVLRSSQITLGDEATGVHTLEHVVAACLGALGMAIGPQARGRLRQAGEQRGLGERQIPRVLAEVGERGGLDADEVAAVGRAVEVEGEDGILIAQPFELGCTQRLDDLARQRAGTRLDEAHGLHRDRRRPRHPPPVPHVLAHRARQRQQIDAVVRAEPFVLDRDGRLDESRAHRIERDGEAPAVAVPDERPQRIPLAIDHPHGSRRLLE